MSQDKTYVLHEYLRIYLYFDEKWIDVYDAWLFIHLGMCSLSIVSNGCTNLLTMRIFLIRHSCGIKVSFSFTRTLFTLKKRVYTCDQIKKANQKSFFYLFGWVFEEILVTCRQEKLTCLI
jgi:hypothetical protein